MYTRLAVDSKINCTHAAHAHAGTQHTHTLAFYRRGGEETLAFGWRASSARAAHAYRVGGFWKRRPPPPLQARRATNRSTCARAPTHFIAAEEWLAVAASRAAAACTRQFCRRRLLPAGSVRPTWWRPVSPYHEERGDGHSREFRRAPVVGRRNVVLC